MILGMYLIIVRKNSIIKAWIYALFFKEGIRMAYMALIMLLAGGDQWLKHRSEAQDPESFPKPLEGSRDRIWIYQNHNPGFPFGFMKRHEELVRLIPLVLTSILGGCLIEKEKTKGKYMDKLSLALVIGGSLSNLYDRYVRGYVGDYFSLRFGPLKKVVFNLGDIFIFLGSGLQAVRFPAAIKEIGKKE